MLHAPHYDAPLMPAHLWQQNSPMPVEREGLTESMLDVQAFAN